MHTKLLATLWITLVIADQSLNLKGWSCQFLRATIISYVQETKKIPKDEVKQYERNCSQTEEFDVNYIIQHETIYQPHN